MFYPRNEQGHEAWSGPSVYSHIIAWLDANCGADGWISTPSSARGVVNDALAVYFVGVTMASAFVVSWCVAQKGEIVDGGVSGPR